MCALIFSPLKTGIIDSKRASSHVTMLIEEEINDGSQS